MDFGCKVGVHDFLEAENKGDRLFIHGGLSFASVKITSSHTMFAE